MEAFASKLKSSASDCRERLEVVSEFVQGDLADLSEQDKEYLEANLGNIVTPVAELLSEPQPGMVIQCLIVLADISPASARLILQTGGLCQKLFDFLKTSVVVYLGQMYKLAADWREGENLASAVLNVDGVESGTTILSRLFSLFSCEGENIFWAVLQLLLNSESIRKLYAEPGQRDAIVVTYVVHENGKILVEGLLRLINRAEDGNRLAAARLLADLLKDKKAASLFYTNDLNILTEVITREITDTGGEGAVLPRMLEALAYAIDNTEYCDNPNQTQNALAEALHSLSKDHPCYDTAVWLIMAMGS